VYEHLGIIVFHGCHWALWYQSELFSAYSYPHSSKPFYCLKCSVDCEFLFLRQSSFVERRESYSYHWLTDTNTFSLEYQWWPLVESCLRTVVEFLWQMVRKLPGLLTNLPLAFCSLLRVYLLVYDTSKFKWYRLDYKALCKMWQAGNFLSMSIIDIRMLWGFSSDVADAIVHSH